MRWLRLGAVAICVLIPSASWAAGLAPRAIHIDSSGPSAVSSYTVSVTTATTSIIGSIRLEFCTAPTGVCTVPAGVDTTSAILTSQSGATGFALVNAVNGSPYLTRAPVNLNSVTPLQYVLGGIVNPSASNQTYYVRVSTYSGDDGATGLVDLGTVALSTAEPVQLTGVTPEILVFCVGTAIAGNCTTVTGSAIDFGDFSPTATRTSTSVMQAQTNASNGYVITVNGTTLASGVNTIPALTAQAASVVGTSQFGLNLRANSSPAVGAEPTGAGSGTYSSNYGQANLFRFNNADVVASAPAPTNANTFTVGYMVNIGGAQAAGVYTATMTYICTASF